MLSQSPFAPSATDQYPARRPLKLLTSAALAGRRIIGDNATLQRVALGFRQYPLVPTSPAAAAPPRAVHLPYRASLLRSTQRVLRQCRVSTVTAYSRRHRLCIQDRVRVTADNHTDKLHLLCRVLARSSNHLSLVCLFARLLTDQSLS